MSIKNILLSAINTESHDSLIPYNASPIGYIEACDTVRDYEVVLESITNNYNLISTAMESIRAHRDNNTLTPDITSIIMSNVHTSLSGIGMESLIDDVSIENYSDIDAVMVSLEAAENSLWDGITTTLSNMAAALTKSWAEMGNVTSITLGKIREQGARLKQSGNTIDNDTVSISNWKPLYNPKSNKVTTDIKDLSKFVDEAIDIADLTKLHALFEAAIIELRKDNKSAVELNRISAINDSIVKHYNLGYSKNKMIGYSPIRWIENNFIYQPLESKDAMLGGVRIAGVSNVGKSGFDAISGKLFLQRLTVENDTIPNNHSPGAVPALSKSEALKYNAELEKLVNSILQAQQKIVKDSKIIDEFKKELDKLKKTGTLETTALVIGLLTAPTWLLRGGVGYSLFSI